MRNYNNYSGFKKIIFHPISRILLGSIVIISATALIKEFITKPLLLSVLDDEALVKIILATLSTGVMIAGYYFVIRYLEKRKFSEFSIVKAPRELFEGLLIGFIIISLIVFLLYSFGYYEVSGVNDFIGFLPTVAFIMGAAMLEEIIFRGLILNILEQWKGTVIAIVVSSVIFQIPHFMNPHEGLLPATLGVLFGMATALLYLDSRRLWVPFAFHFGWNIAQPIFGTTLSGIDEFDVLLVAKLNGPELLTGSAFGIEDSLLSMLALLSIIIIYYYRVSSRGNWVGKGVKTS